MFVSDISKNCVKQRRCVVMAEVQPKGKMCAKLLRTVAAVKRPDCVPLSAVEMLKGQFTQNTKKIICHSPIVVSSHADYFAAICPGQW